MIDTEAIRRANPLPAIAARLVRLEQAGSEWTGCCPFHADRSPSFTIFSNGTRFHCFGCGASGDVLNFVQKAYGVGFPDAVRMLGEPITAEFALPELKAPAPADQADHSPAARTIWAKAVPAAKTLAEAYLCFRGIAPPYPPDVRFLNLRCDNLGPLPCLVLAVRDVAGAITGIQRIWLANDGEGKANIVSPKRSLGKVKGGAIRLGDLDRSGMVTVCEGPEDGLSLLEQLGGPVWVAAGASFLPAMHFPPEVRSIVIGADNDLAGEQSAELAARAFALRSLTVRIVRPLEGFKDFNDELRGTR